MKRFVQCLATALLAAVLVVGVAGCKKEGPAERAGKQIDKAVEKAGEQIEKVGEKVQDAVNK